MRVNAVIGTFGQFGTANLTSKNNGQISSFQNENLKAVPNQSYGLLNYKFNPLFKAKFFVEDGLEKEARFSEIARKMEVNTPKVIGTYDIKGQNADFETNPVTDRKLKATLDEILKIDKAGIFHGDIEQAHVFYTKGEDKPEFDCFRFGFKFDEDEQRAAWEFPNCVYPTNLYQFEGNWVGHYMSKMTDEQQKDFLRNYLVLSSDFHAQKAQYLKDEGIGTDEQIEFEQLKADLYKNPSDDIVDLVKDRINLEQLERQAFTECDEGMGACGYDIDENRIIKGNLLYFEVLKKNLKYLSKVEELQSSNDDLKTAKLLDYYKEYALHKNDKQVNANIGRTLWSVNPDNEKFNLHHRTPCDEEKKSYQTMYDGLIEASSKRKFDLEYDMLQMAQMQYGVVVNRSKSD